jgi:hypothetical protein
MMTERNPESRRRLLEAWTKIEERLERRRLPAISSRPFVEYAWENFDVKEVTSILASPEPSYYAHKDILFDGLCAWVACPSKPMLIKHAMTLTAVKFLQSAEAAGREMYGVGQLGDILIRTHQIGHEFFEQIYYPIGGVAQLAKCPSRGGFRKQLQSGASGIPHIVMLMSIFHFHLVNLQDTSEYNEVLKPPPCSMLLSRARRRSESTRAF